MSTEAETRVKRGRAVRTQTVQTHNTSVNLKKRHENRLLEFLFFESLFLLQLLGVRVADLRALRPLRACGYGLRFSVSLTIEKGFYGSGFSIFVRDINMIAYLCPRHSSCYTLCRERGQTRERSRILIYADHIRTAVPFRFVFDAHT